MISHSKNKYVANQGVHPTWHNIGTVTTAIRGGALKKGRLSSTNSGKLQQSEVIGLDKGLS